MTGRSAYVERMKVQVALWAAEIDRLRAGGAEAGDDARMKLTHAIEELGILRDRAAAKLQEADAAADEAWDDMQEGFEAAWYGLSDAVRSVKDRLP